MHLCILHLCIYTDWVNSHKSSNAHPDFWIQHELSSAIFLAETRSYLKLTSALYHFKIWLYEELIFWEVFQCKRVMRVYFLSCIVVRLQKPIGLFASATFSGIFPDKTTNVLKSSLLYAIHYNVVINWFWRLDRELQRVFCLTFTQRN
jgi:hypothetical protein